VVDNLAWFLRRGLKACQGRRLWRRTALVARIIIAIAAVPC
jgi:hypothetical protein